MKPAPFDYVRPESLDAALAILAEHGDTAKVLAGGQSLIPAMNFRVAQPTMLIDLNDLSDLEYVRRNDDGELRIGSMTRLRQLERDALIAEHAPLLHEIVPHIAHPQIRNRSTVGGSIVHADPAAELPVYILVRAARMRFKSAKGERWVAHDKCFLGMFMTVCEADEILVEVALSAVPARCGWSFMEVARRSGDYAMAGVAALVTLNEDGTCEKACLVYLNAGDGPVDARQAAQLLQGEKIDDETIEAAAQMAAEKEIDPLGSVHASVAYQRHLAKVLTRRALKQALERASSDAERRQ